MSSSTSIAWNPRYVMYAKAHGKSPDQMLDSDRERWPGGVMIGFILWIDRLRIEYGRYLGVYGDEVSYRIAVNPAGWDAWLASATERQAKGGIQ